VPTRRVRLPASNDTRLLVVGVAAFVALVAYLGVAFVNTRATVDIAMEVAPWTPYGSTLLPVPPKTRGRFSVQVIATKDATGIGSYGALAPTLVPEPSPGTRFAVGLLLKSARPGPIGVQIHEFRAATPSQYLVNTTVAAKPRWQHFVFRGKVDGSWTGLSMYVYRPTAPSPKRSPSFVIRGLTVKLR
jgi:hypothetical protein